MIARLTKAVNGLRSAPLSWYKEISSFLDSEGFTQIIDPTIFRKLVWRNDARFLSVVLFYVDDILICKKYKLKRTGFIQEGCEGEVTFLGRKIFWTKEMAGKNAVMFGLEPAYLWSCCEESQITKGTLKLPTLEKITKGEKSIPLSPEAHDRYRRVLKATGHTSQGSEMTHELPETLHSRSLNLQPLYFRCQPTNNAPRSTFERPGSIDKQSNLLRITLVLQGVPFRSKPDFSPNSLLRRPSQGARQRCPGKFT